MASLERDGDVFILNLGEDENRINPESGEEILSLLDEVEATEGPKALVTTASGKFFSNGLDLEWAGSDLGRLGQTVDALVTILGRIVTFPAPTAAAIQGHCYAGGAMISLAHDVRIMRADRGWWCLPEVDLKMGFTDGMAALVQSKLPLTTARDAMIFGLRWGGEGARDLGIIDEAVGEHEVLARAIERVAPLAAKADPVMGAIKRRMYAAARRGLVPSTEAPAG